MIFHQTIRGVLTNYLTHSKTRCFETHNCVNINVDVYKSKIYTGKKIYAISGIFGSWERLRIKCEIWEIGQLTKWEIRDFISSIIFFKNTFTVSCIYEQEWEDTLSYFRNPNMASKNSSLYLSKRRPINPTAYFHNVN